MMTNHSNTKSTLYNSAGYARIRTPHPHDVLSGRGGGINSHVGNQQFRQWVQARKEDYNLAPTKVEKTQVATEVMDLVRSLNPPGRFLQRDPTSVSGPGWWIEVDETRAMAKTCQALREGAPKIRAAHKEELEAKKLSSRRRRSVLARKKKQQEKLQSAQGVSLSNHPRPPSHASGMPIPSTFGNVQASTALPAPAARNPNEALEFNKDEAMRALRANAAAAKALRPPVRMFSPKIVTPLMTNQEFNSTYGEGNSERPSKRVKVEDDRDDQPTRPLWNGGNHGNSYTQPLEDPLNILQKQSNIRDKEGLSRSHSLALSDFSSEIDIGGENFVDPFADESHLIDDEKDDYNISSMDWQTPVENNEFPLDHVQYNSHDQHLPPLRNVSSISENNGNNSHRFPFGSSSHSGQVPLTSS